MDKNFNTQIDGIDVKLNYEEAIELQRKLDTWLENYMRNNNFLYTVRRFNPDNDSCYGSIHYSDDCNKTACGLKIDDKWYILTTNYDGVVTCPKCEKLQK